MTARTKGDARSAILNAATTVFTADGIDGISMRHIAGEIVVSATALGHPMHYDVMMMRPRTWAFEVDLDKDPESFAGLVALVEACQAAGQLRQGDAREAAHMVWAALHGTVSLALSMPGEIRGLEAQPVRTRGKAMVEAVIASLL